MTTVRETEEQFHLNTTDVFLNIGSLHPYYTYTFSVTAVTIGQGPYDDPLTVRTLQDGNLIFHCL